MKSGITIRRGEKRISHRGRWRDRRGRRGAAASPGTQKFPDVEPARARLGKVGRKEGSVSE